MKDLVKEYISDLGNNPLCTTLNKGKIRLSTILDDFNEKALKSLTSVSSRIISESDKPKGLDLEKLELKLDKALQRDYSDSEANGVCIICGEETITLCRTHAKQVLNLQDLFDDTDER